jgi:hypothetical protein
LGPRGRVKGRQPVKGLAQGLVRLEIKDILGLSVAQRFQLLLEQPTLFAQPNGFGLGGKNLLVQLLLLLLDAVKLGPGLGQFIRTLVAKVLFVTLVQRGDDAEKTAGDIGSAGTHTKETRRKNPINTIATTLGA